MKVLGISSSARLNGNTAIIIGKVFEKLTAAGIETELIQLAQQEIKPCKACFACGGRANCIHTGDAFREVFQKLAEADGVILGSPVYSANVSSTMQAFLERAAVVADMNPNLLTYKVGAAVAAVRRGGALAAIDTMNRFFINHEMFVVGATYWGMVYGQMPDDVLNDAEGLSTMKNLGHNMAYLLTKLKGESGIC